MIDEARGEILRTGFDPTSGRPQGALVPRVMDERTPEAGFDRFDWDMDPEECARLSREQTAREPRRVFGGTPTRQANGTRNTLQRIVSVREGLNLQGNEPNEREVDDTSTWQNMSPYERNDLAQRMDVQNARMLSRMNLNSSVAEENGVDDENDSDDAYGTASSSISDQEVARTSCLAMEGTHYQDDYHGLTPGVDDTPPITAADREQIAREYGRAHRMTDEELARIARRETRNHATWAEQEAA